MFPSISYPLLHYTITLHFVHFMSYNDRYPRDKRESQEHSVRGGREASRGEGGERARQVYLLFSLVIGSIKTMSTFEWFSIHFSCSIASVYRAIDSTDYPLDPMSAQVECDHLTDLIICFSHSRQCLPFAQWEPLFRFLVGDGIPADLPLALSSD